MRTVLRKKWLGIPVAVLALILVATVALAAFAVINLTSSGEITITEAPPPPPLTEVWSADTTVLVFGDTSNEENQPLAVASELITITNDGEASITDIAVVLSNVPAGLTATPNLTVSYPLETSETATLTVTLTGTAPGYPATIDLSGITATLTAN